MPLSPFILALLLITRFTYEMHFLKALYTASVAAVATATYVGNLNYGSPSLHAPFLGISIRKVASRSEGSSPWTPEQLNFTHGVASGDPYDDSVILWTRVAPTMDNDRNNVTVEGTAPMYAHDNDVFVKASKSPICVDWKIGRSASMDGQPFKSGTAYTSSDVDFTVKVEAKALTVYYYQFNVCNSDIKSPVGRTQTLPESGTKVKRAIKLAAYSCANYLLAGENRLRRPVGGDSVEFGNLKGGVTKQTNLTNDTNTGKWFVFESSKAGGEEEF
ncbi:phosphodiesterase/alkaline phosphatase D [Colletotrichum salicis]|uniref:Phosphodiesterase/alkaline phosphatase D n=1 Tax=Colletotrichum salicis TaxID=1209931 RepID=A0A135T8Y5_9PEZI|nr:phosphodiesterase/alkaline phosphatase D [Colletotrichum salicis]